MGFPMPGGTEVVLRLPNHTFLDPPFARVIGCKRGTYNGDYPDGDGADRSMGAGRPRNKRVKEMELTGT